MKNFCPATLAVLALGCAAKRDLPPDQIVKLTKLADVMDVQATLADPQFKKVDAENYTDADWAAFADLGNRIQVTSKKIHQFSRGPGFDQLAERLHANAVSLSAAVVARDVPGASSELAAMQKTCKECHSKFR